MGNFAENLNLGNRFRPPPPVRLEKSDTPFFFFFFLILLCTQLKVSKYVCLFVRISLACRFCLFVCFLFVFVCLFVCWGVCLFVFFYGREP